MIPISDVLSMLFDPRGRLGRLGLLVSATAMLGLEALVLTLSPGAGEALPATLWPLKIVALWIGIAALIKRLHDVDLSGWWVLAGAAGLCIWTAVLAFLFVFGAGAQSLDAGTFGYIALTGLVMLPAIGAALWLHLAAGLPYANRFGPVPGQEPGQPTGETQAEGLQKAV
jgi:uncharacterized membrane protein YhaH (DUF805 family)